MTRVVFTEASSHPSLLAPPCHRIECAICKSHGRFDTPPLPELHDCQACLLKLPVVEDDEATNVEQWPQPLERRRDRAVQVPVDAEEREALFDTARGFVAQRMRGYEAPLKIVDAVEAAATSTTFKAGLEREWELFAELAAGQQAAALQYVFFAERKVARVDPA